MLQTGEPGTVQAGDDVDGEGIAVAPDGLVDTVDTVDTVVRDGWWQRAIRSRWAIWVLLYAVALLALPRIRCQVVGANDSSRYSTMIALVEQGTPYIDGVDLAKRTMDKVRVNGRDLSTKPPVLSVIGAGIYYVLHNAFGLTFKKNEAVVVPILVALLCTLPLLVLLWAFHGGSPSDPGRPWGSRPCWACPPYAFPLAPSWSITCRAPPRCSACSSLPGS